MNYANHNLRTDLQEWKNRLSRAPFGQFGSQLKYLLDNLGCRGQIVGILTEAKNQYPYTDDELAKKEKELSRLTFQNEVEHATFCHQFLMYYTKKIDNYNIHNYYLLRGRDFDGTKELIIETLISPIIYFLHDKLDKSNSVVYLLEKYKKRTEWFTRTILLEKYNNVDKNYEQIFEDDLRLFLFDQGIDYPFSTPSSASGRVDIVGQIDTDDPLIVEIKIIDINKKYGIQRIKDGFKQAVKYSNDYNKDVGYIVIYNINSNNINLSFRDSDKIFPPSLIFGNKVFYFIVMNLNFDITASKSGTIPPLTITDDFLLE